MVLKEVMNEIQETIWIFNLRYSFDRQYAGLQLSYDGFTDRNSGTQFDAYSAICRRSTSYIHTTFYCHDDDNTASNRDRDCYSHHGANQHRTSSDSS